MIDFRWMRVSISMFLTLFSVVVYAQAGGGIPPGPPPANPVPISGIEILLGAGALLGAKRYWNGRKGNSRQ